MSVPGAAGPIPTPSSELLQMNASLDLLCPPTGPLIPRVPKRHLLGGREQLSQMYPIFTFTEATLCAV